jgi:head-tail adaptor
MSIELEIADDFATIIDGAEPMTLKRRDSAATIAISKARRFSSHLSDAGAAGGHVAQTDVDWQFPWDDAHQPPRLGDALFDAAGNCFTILSVEDLAAKTRIRCSSRNLHLAYQLNNRVELQQAVWEDAGGGPEIVGWKTIRSALPARIQPERLAVDNESSPATATATYRIILGEQIELNADSRFVDPQGNVYQLMEYTQAERIAALPVATVVRLQIGQ